MRKSDRWNCLFQNNSDAAIGERSAAALEQAADGSTPAFVLRDSHGSCVQSCACVPVFMRLSTPGGLRTWLALTLMGGGVAGVAVGIARNQALWVGLGLWFTSLGVGLWFLNEWSRRLAVASGILLVLGDALVSPSWDHLPFLLAGVPVLWLYWHFFSPAKVALHKAASSLGTSDSDRPPMTSLVLLLRNPRSMSARVLSQYVQSAWGGVFHSGSAMPKDEDTTTGRFVVGNKPSFLVSSPDGMFLVNIFDAPYFDDPESIANEVGDLRLRRMLEENRAWLSVDLMVPPQDEAQRLQAYRPIARLVAELSGADCIALFCPETNQWLPWTNAMEEKLRTEDPLALFASEASVPVVEVPPDDPRMKAAADEAQQRWLEFESAFRTRNPALEQHFGVKVPITEGESTEFIWVEVLSIQNAAIQGRLANDPVELGSLRLGSDVNVPVSQVMDWAYVQDGEPVGLFGVKALKRIQEEGAAGSKESAA